MSLGCEGTHPGSGSHGFNVDDCFMLDAAALAHRQNVSYRRDLTFVRLHRRRAKRYPDAMINQTASTPDEASNGTPTKNPAAASPELTGGGRLYV